MNKLTLVAGLLSFFLLRCGGDDTITSTDSGLDAISDAKLDSETSIFKPTDSGLVDGQFDLGRTQNDPMSYFGGHVMTGPANVYFIWYGNWTNTQTAPILEDMISNVGNSAWFQINTSYYQQLSYSLPDASDDAEASLGPKMYVDGRVNFMQSVYVGYTDGLLLRHADISSVVERVIGNGKLPYDPVGIYYVLTSADVDQTFGFSEFCSDYCGWHDNFTILNQNVRIAFVGDSMRCPSDCTLQEEYKIAGFNSTPNGDWSADSMATIVLHELSEVVTDPDPEIQVAWNDESGYENADKCAWTYGTLYVTANHSVANVPIGNRHFLVQQNWVLDNDGGHCGLRP